MVMNSQTGPGGRRDGGGRYNRTVVIRIGDHEVVLKTIIKYQRIMIDAKLTFKDIWTMRGNT